MSGSADAVHFLLDLNPSSLEATDQEGRTALHLASGHRLGSDGTLTALLAAGADMESKTALGETSLLKACKALRVSAVRILLRWGADEAAIDADGRTPVAMVSQMLRSQHPGVFRDMLKTILRVLDGAPADRVWRRRGWLLMVRLYSRREGFHVAEGGGGGGGGDCGRSSCCREGFHHTEGGGGGCGRSSEGFHRTEGGGSGGGDCSRVGFHPTEGGGGGDCDRVDFHAAKAGDCYGPSSCGLEGFHVAGGGGGGGCGCPPSYRQGFYYTEGGGGGYGRSSEGLHRTESGGRCEPSPCGREGFHRTEGGDSGDCAIAAKKRVRRSPPARKIAEKNRMDVGKNENSRPGRKADYRENIAVLLRPRSNCANPRVNCAAQDSKKDDDDDDDWCHARTRRIVVEPERLLERSCGRVGFGGGESGGDRALRSVVERAVGVEEEGIFRSIVAFL